MSSNDPMQQPPGVAHEESEKRYRALFNTMHEGFAFHEVVCNEQGDVVDYRYLDINPAFEQLTGLRRDTTVGRTVREVLPDIEEDWIRCFGNVAMTGISDEKESYVRELDRYYRARAYSPEKGKFAVVFEETTAMRRAQRELERREMLYNNLVETATDLIWRCDHEGRYTFLNKAWEVTFGYSIDEMLGHHFTEFMPASQAERDTALFAKLLATSGRVKDYETIHLRKDGTPVHLVFNATFYLDEAGQIVGTQGTAHDITEQKLAENALRRTNEMFSLFMRYSPVYVYMKEVTTEASRVLQASDNFQDMIGIKGSDMTGKTMDELFPPGLAAKITADDRDVVEQGRVLKLDEELNGRFYTTIKFPIVQNDRTLLAGFTIDVTEQKRAEEERFEQQQMISAIVESSRDWIWAIDVAGKHTYSNPAVQHILGYAPEEFRGLGLELMHPEDREVIGKLWPEWIASHKGWRNLVMRWRAKDGSYRYLESTAVPIVNSKGTLLGFRGVDRDITERKRLEEERLRLEHQLLHAQKLESLGVLAGGIAHDFNNILMAIIGNTDIALMRLTKESPVIENLQKIEQAAVRAADLARQMLAYSGKGRFVVEQVDLNKLLGEMLHMLEVSISKNAMLRFNTYDRLPAVDADATQIRQIVMNLVINASEAIGDKSGMIAVSTGVMDCDQGFLKDAWLGENLKEGRYVYLEIADTGCGMDEDTLAKIFDPFFTTKFTGRGLGMAAVLGILRGHRGAVKIYSKPGKGTTFTILLPASSRSAELDDGGTSRDDRWRGTGTVLLVDDEETVRGIGAEMLRVLGFEVVTALDGCDALIKYRENPGIAFVILDLTMPHLDGEQCFKELRQIDKDVKVIMSSGFNEQEVVQKFAGEGLSGFIQKPYKLSTLKDVIMKLA